LRLREEYEAAGLQILTLYIGNFYERMKLGAV